MRHPISGQPVLSYHGIVAVLTMSGIAVTWSDTDTDAKATLSKDGNVVAIGRATSREVLNSSRLARSEPETYLRQLMRARALRRAHQAWIQS